MLQSWGWEVCPEAHPCLLLPVPAYPSCGRKKLLRVYTSWSAWSWLSIRISRDDPLTKKLLCFLTALWMLVIVLEVFELHVPRDLLPFVLVEPAEGVYSSFGITWLWCNTWRPYHMYFSFWVFGTICNHWRRITHCWHGSPTSPASYSALCDTTATVFEESNHPSLNSQEEIDAADAVLLATSEVCSSSESPSEQGQDLSFRSVHQRVLEFH